MRTRSAPPFTSKLRNKTFAYKERKDKKNMRKGEKREREPTQNQKKTRERSGDLDYPERGLGLRRPPYLHGNRLGSNERSGSCGGQQHDVEKWHDRTHNKTQTHLEVVQGLINDIALVCKEKNTDTACQGVSGVCIRR
jgi:hypothetical protein